MTGPTAAGIHDALVYDADEALLDAAVPFLRAGLDAGEAAVVVCGERKNALLMEALDGDGRIIALSQAEVYQRPPAAIATYGRLVDHETAAGTPHIRVVGELDVNGRAYAWDEWVRYESTLNHAFAGAPVSVVCGYDVRSVPAEVVTSAWRTHPNVTTDRVRAPSPGYVEPADYLRRTGVAEWDSIEAGPPSWQTDAATEVATLRRGLRAALVAGGRRGPAVDDFVMAANEVASNALLYGCQPVQVRLWVTPTRSVCSITDRGSGFDDPFAGYLRPGDGEHGRGLWLARQLCDTVQTNRRDGRFTVRLSLHHESPVAAA